jgi:hypothetical protein
VTRRAGLRYDLALSWGENSREQQAMQAVPIDWASVNWIYVGVLAVFAFFASLVGSLLSFGHRGWGAVLAAILFAAIFVAYSYYPHHLPLPNPLAAPKAVPAAAKAPAPATPAAPSPPKNPVTDITPPKNPVTDVTPTQPAR